MNVSTAIRTRRSIRYFQDREIPEDILREILLDAQRAPSWANSQPWKAYVATGETLAQIKNEHKAASLSRVRGRAEFHTAHRQAWSDETRQNMARWSNQLQSHLGPQNGAEYGDSQQDLFNAAAIVYMTIPKDSTLWSVLDLGAYMQTLMLSAVGYGLQTMSAYETIRLPQIVRRIMDIPDTETLAIGVALGYGDESAINEFKSERVPLEEMVIVKS